MLRAALRRAKANDTVALVEATANQVNQNGGYTGMTPVDFHAFVERLAREEGLAPEKVLCGGDHLGPLTWRHLPEADAMGHAQELVRAYVLAGFSKSISTPACALQATTLTGACRTRSSQGGPHGFAARPRTPFSNTKKAAPEAPAPVYVVGSEVPVPGGAQGKRDSVAVTAPEACEAALAEFERFFACQGLTDAWGRVAALWCSRGGICRRERRHL